MYLTLINPDTMHSLINDGNASKLYHFVSCTIIHSDVAWVVPSPANSCMYCLDMKTVVFKRLN